MVAMVVTVDYCCMGADYNMPYLVQSTQHKKNSAFILPPTAHTAKK